MKIEVKREKNPSYAKSSAACDNCCHTFAS